MGDSGELRWNAMAIHFKSTYMIFLRVKQYGCPLLHTNKRIPIYKWIYTYINIYIILFDTAIVSKAWPLSTVFCIIRILNLSAFRNSLT